MSATGARNSGHWRGPLLLLHLHFYASHACIKRVTFHYSPVQDDIEGYFGRGVWIHANG